MHDDATIDAGAPAGHLLRILGVAFGVAVVVGGTIGQGILRTPGLVAQGAPSAGLILGLWAFGGVVAFIDAMSTVELASSIRMTGGPYTFTRRAFGPMAALATGITDWLGNVGATAYVTVVFGEYLHRLGVAGGVPVGVLALGLVAAIAAVQWLGTRVSGRSQELGSAVKALLFLALVGALMLAPRGAVVASAGPPVGLIPALTLSGLVVAMRGISGTYQGWNSAAYFCEEVKDPGRAISRATFSGIAVVMALYLLVNMAFLHVLSPAEMAGSKLVAADAAARVFGPQADRVVTAVSLISLITIANATVMICTRVFFAVARDAELPALSRVARNGAPRVALVVTAVASGLLALVGVYDILLAFSISLLATLGLIVNVDALVLRWREPTLERPWRMPLFPLPALLALAVNGTLLVLFLREDPVTSAEAFAALAVLTGAGYVLTRGKA